MCWHGVVWLQGLEMGFDYCDGTVSGGDEGVDFIVDEKSGGGLDGGTGFYAGCYAVELDAEALYFDLVVYPAEDMEGAVGVPLAEISSVVHTRTEIQVSIR
jgi:hypothetical protein